MFIFLATLEDEVKEAEIKSKPKTKEQDVKEKYEKIDKKYQPVREKVYSEPSLGQKLKATVNNVKNVARNAVDNTVGYGIAKYQNYKTKKHFKNEPASNDEITYLMHGLFQNEGSQWRLAKQLRKEGKQAYHLKGHHSLPKKENIDRTYEQIGDFHNNTKLENVKNRNDKFSGHSSGGNIGIYMAEDERTAKYGIKKIQARAPATYGFKAKSIGQKLLLPFAKAEDASTYEGMKHGLEASKGKPAVPIQILAGEHDNLVPPPNAVHIHSGGKAHIKPKVLKGKNSTHFGTAGGEEEMNRVMIGYLNDPKAYKIREIDKPTNLYKPTK